MESLPSDKFFALERVRFALEQILFETGQKKHPADGCFRVDLQRFFVERGVRLVEPRKTRFKFFVGRLEVLSERLFVGGPLFGYSPAAEEAPGGFERV